MPGSSRPAITRRQLLANGAGLAATAALSTRAHAARRSSPEPFLAPETRSVSALGTVVELVSYPAENASRAAVARAADAALAEVERIHKLVSAQEPESDIARVNGAAGSLSVVVSEETFALVRRSAELSEFSGGVFDVTYAAMRRLWTFDQRGGTPVLPDPEEVKRLRRLVDYRKIILDEQRHAVMLPSAEMRLGLGALARGYALDRAQQLLEGSGPRGIRMRAGNLHVSRGEIPADLDRVELADPRLTSRPWAEVAIHGSALASAVDHDRFFIVGSRRYHPIIDPRTGYPARTVRAASVLAPRAMDADWLATALFVLGPKDSGPVLAHVAGAQAVWVTAQNTVEMTAGMKKRLKQLTTPTDGNP